MTAGSPTLLYSGTGVSDGCTPSGANDTDVILQSGNGAVYSLPIGKASTEPRAIAASVVPSDTSEISVSVVAASPTSAAGALVFVSDWFSDASGNSFYSSTVVTSGGTVRQALQAGTTYADGDDGYPGTLVGLLPGAMIQVAAISETDTGYGGGHFNLINVATLSSTPLTTPAGIVYTVPAGPGLIPQFNALTPTLAAGVLQVPPYNYPPFPSKIGLVIDLTKHLVVPISIASTDVSPF